MPIRHRIAPLAATGGPIAALCGIRRDFSRLSPCGGQVAYVLLTRAPVAGGSIAAPPLPLDLHVLSLSLAFILSQDQTLRCCYLCFFFFRLFWRHRLGPKTSTTCDTESTSVGSSDAGRLH